VALQRDRKIGRSDPRAVVAHPDQLTATGHDLDPDRMCAGIERVFDQLFDH
jgi:hypothetical protein